MASKKKEQSEIQEEARLCRQQRAVKGLAPKPAQEPEARHITLLTLHRGHPAGGPLLATYTKAGLKLTPAGKQAGLKATKVLLDALVSLDDYPAYVFAKI